MVSVQRVLILDREHIMKQMVSQLLGYFDEFNPTIANDGNDVLRHTQTNNFDAIILSADCDDLAGKEISRQLRENNIWVPIIFLFARDLNVKKFMDSELGATAYITKPFRITALIALLRIHIYNYQESQNGAMIIGQYIFKPSSNILVHCDDNNVLNLTSKETAILKFLYGASNRMVPREILLEKVWGYNAGVTTHTLETHIYRLRQKIETDPANALILGTEPGGYILKTFVKGENKKA